MERVAHVVVVGGPQLGEDPPGTGAGHPEGRHVTGESESVPGEEVVVVVLGGPNPDLQWLRSRCKGRFRLRGPREP